MVFRGVWTLFSLTEKQERVSYNLKNVRPNILKTCNLYIFKLDSLAPMVLFPDWWEIDSLQKPDQNAVALVELGMAFLANKLR